MVGHFLGVASEVEGARGVGRPVHVALLGDADLVREGLLAVCLRRSTSIKLVDCEQHGLPIDLLLVDPWQQRWTTGDELAQTRSLLRPRQVVCFSWKSDADAIRASVGMGFDQYLSKQTPTTRLVNELLAMVADPPTAQCRGGRARHEVAGHVDPRWARSLSRPPAGLTRRELDVVLLVMDGLRNEEIGRRLYLSANTVKSYIRSAYHKMGVTSRAQAVRWGCDNLLVNPTARTGNASVPAVDDSSVTRLAS